MKDKNGHHSSDVLVAGVCLFELSSPFFYSLCSRSTVSVADEYARATEEREHALRMEHTERKQHEKNFRVAMMRLVLKPRFPFCQRR